MSRKIRLYTDSWEYYADVENDKLFGDSGIIPDVDVLGEVNELKLTDSLGEIIEREWPYITRLLEEMDKPVFIYLKPDTTDGGCCTIRVQCEEDILTIVTGRQLFASDKVTSHNDEYDTRYGKVRYKGEELVGTLNCSNEGAHIFSRAWKGYKIVYLDNIQHTSQLLTLPHGWEYFVAVDYSTPQIVRLAHMKRLLKLISCVRDAYLIGERRWRSSNTESLSMSIIHEMEEEYMDPSDTPNCYYYMLALLSLRHMCAHGEGGRHSSIPLYYEGIVWEDVAVILQTIADEGESYGKYLLSTLSRTLDMMNGKTTVSMKEACKDRATYDTPSADVYDEVGNTTVFESLLRCYPEDVDPVLLGMGPILDDKPMPKRVESECTIDTYIQSYVLRVMEDYGSYLGAVPARLAREGVSWLDTTQFKYVVEDTENRFGTRLLERMLLSLRHWLNRHETDRDEVQVSLGQWPITLGQWPNIKSKRAEAFCHTIEKSLRL